jgi:hypothetical protein
MAKGFTKVSKIECPHCEGMFFSSFMQRHLSSCKHHPDRIIHCKVCNEVTKGGQTCSRACANTFYRTGPNHPNWNPDNYRTTCFHFHKFECVVCGEDKIVEVHHFDENHQNNDPSNLVPLCPTHHQYWHSRYRSLVEEPINRFLEKFNGA